MEESRLKTIQRLNETGGNVKGSCTNGIFTYLEFLGVADKIPEILEKTSEYGSPTEKSEVDPFAMYPLAQEMALIFAVKDVLGWGEVEVKEMGRNIPRVSTIVKFFLKYFVTLERSTEEAKNYWKRHYDFAELTVTNIDVENANYIVEVRNFDVHRVYAVFLCGFLETMIGFVTKYPLASEVVTYSQRGDGVNIFRFWYATENSRE